MQQKPLWQAIGSALALAAWNSGAEATPIDFNYTGAATSWTVSATGVYHIVAFGAQGGNDGAGGDIGGRGAEIGGDFSLSAGQTLTIAVGGAGGNANLTSGGGVGTSGGAGGSVGGSGGSGGGGSGLRLKAQEQAGLKPLPNQGGAVRDAP